MAESGVAGFLAASYIGILAPAGTPADVLSRLESALAAALKLPKTLSRMGELGVEPASPEQQTASGFAAFIRQDYENSREAARIAQLKKE
jgi:tripartite-type tricarboxylate transporter receptor subunit TctC